MNLHLSCGDQIELKKTHPCGGALWEVVRIGADFKIKCLTCGHVLMIPREKLYKSVKHSVKQQASQENR